MKSAKCVTAADAQESLRSRLDLLAARADAWILDLYPASTYPRKQTPWFDQPLIDDLDYHDSIASAHESGHGAGHVGLHVHIGIPRQETTEKTEALAVQASQVMTLYVPHIIALTASSVFHDGRPTNDAASRSETTASS